MSKLPGRGSDQFPLRLPDGMRDELKAAAEANNRSMNAEITARLQRSFDDSDDVESATAKAFVQSQEVKRLRGILESSFDPQKVLYVALDADGKPTSWSEITTHLGEIGRAARLRIDTIQARIFDPALITNDERDEQWWQLVQHYRSLKPTKAGKPKK